MRNSPPEDGVTDNSLPASQNQDGRGRPLAPKWIPQCGPARRLKQGGSDEQ